MPTNLPDVALKLEEKLSVSALQCQTEGAVYMAEKAQALEQKRGWNGAGKQTGSMGDVPVKLHVKGKNLWR
jgi:hypothetical protein